MSDNNVQRAERLKQFVSTILNNLAQGGGSDNTVLTPDIAQRMMWDKIDETVLDNGILERAIEFRVEVSDEQRPAFEETSGHLKKKILTSRCLGGLERELPAVENWQPTPEQLEGDEPLQQPMKKVRDPDVFYMIVRTKTFAEAVKLVREFRENGFGIRDWSWGCGR